MVYLFRRWLKFTKLLCLSTLIILIIVLVLTRINSPEESINNLQFIANTWQTYFGLMSLGIVQRSILLVLYISVGILVALSFLIDQGWLYTCLSLFLLTSLTGLLLARSSTTSALFVLIGSATTAIMTQERTAGSTLTSFRSFLLAVIAFPGLLTTNYLLNTRPVDFFNWTPFFFLFIILILLFSFPFQIWIASTVSEARSFVPAVSFGLVQLVLLLYLVGMIAKHPIIFRNSRLLELLGVSGALTILVAAIFLGNVSTTRRLFGYLVVMDLGTTTMALALGADLGLELAIFIVINRFVGLFIAGAALDLVEREQSINSGAGNFSSAIAAAKGSPTSLALLIYGLASIAGFPLTPGFAGRWALIKAISVQHPGQAVIVVIAMVVALIVIIQHFLSNPTHRTGKVAVQKPFHEQRQSAMVILFSFGALMTIFSPVVLAFVRSLLYGL